MRAASSGVTPLPFSRSVRVRPRKASSSATPGRIACGAGRAGRGGASAAVSVASSASGVCWVVPGDGGGDGGAAAGAHPLDQLQPQPLGQLGREAQHVVEGVVDLEEGADPRALGPAGGGEQRQERRLLAGEDAAPGGQRRHPGALVMAEAEADLVLLDHGDIGVGRGLRAADQRLHRGEARLAGLGQSALSATSRRQPEIRP